MFISTSQNSSSFLQPILSVLGLIVSALTAVAPLFAQSQLDSFFLDKTLSLTASVVSIILGVLLSWYLISLNGYINIPIGVRKDRGNGYRQSWRQIDDNNAVPTVIILSIILFVGFFVIGQQEGYYWAIGQVAVYILFFTLIIGTFSYLIAQTKNRYEWKQQVASTGTHVYETLERNGIVKSGIKIIQNTQVTNLEELDSLGISRNEQILMKRLVVETVKQDPHQLIVFMSSDYERLITAVPVPKEK